MIRVAGAVLFGMLMFKTFSYGEGSAPEAKVVQASLSLPDISTEPFTEEESTLTSAELAEQKLSSIYQVIFSDESSKPAYEVFRKGMVGYLNLQRAGKLKNENILTLIDFSLPSVQKRLWVVDLASNKVLFHDLVAHGKNSGGNIATTFSNTPNSNMSSLGFYVTANTYFGKHGLSLRLAGQEAGFNSNAMQRAVVMHGADYVNEGICKSIGRLGRSFGCPAISMDIYKEVINTVANGSCMFIYHTSVDYHKASALLQEPVELHNQLLATN
jgi:hypothetical protein